MSEATIPELIQRKIQTLEHLDQRKWRIPSRFFDRARKILPSCLHIAQDTFGSAFCFNGKKGLIMTSTLCLAEEIKTENSPLSMEVEEVEANQKIVCENEIKKCLSEFENVDSLKSSQKIYKMFFSNGEEVNCVLLQANYQLGIAVLKIIHIDPIFKKTYPSVRISLFTDYKHTAEILCVGNPSFFDREKNNRKWLPGHEPFTISNGNFKGYLPNSIYGNVHEKLGPLKHSCWTYWGHEGAPIFNRKCQVIGIHNSYAKKTGQRHGISPQAMKEFMRLYPQLFENEA